jgi:hypothetical protein
MKNINSAHEDLGFAANYTLRILDDCADAAIHEFRRQRRSAGPDGLVWDPPLKHKPMFVEVSPEFGGPWIGCFQPGLDGVSGLFSTPSPEKFCVVVAGEGYLVSAYSPSDYETIRCIPVKFVRRIPQKDMIVFGSLTDLAAYDARGLVWNTPRLSWDGLQLTDVSERQIHGLAWDSAAGREVPFVVDVDTGHHKGGSSPEMYMTANQ